VKTLIFFYHSRQRMPEVSASTDHPHLKPDINAQEILYINV